MEILISLSMYQFLNILLKPLKSSINTHNQLLHYKNKLKFNNKNLLPLDKLFNNNNLLLLDKLFNNNKLFQNNNSILNNSTNMEDMLLITNSFLNNNTLFQHMNNNNK